MDQVRAGPPAPRCPSVDLFREMAPDSRNESTFAVPKRPRAMTDRPSLPHNGYRHRDAKCMSYSGFASGYASLVTESPSVTHKPSSYLVLASQRSGSTLLVESLRATGVAGEPQEFFQSLPTTS